MADYISTLTGSQMDSALLDMAEHNSEAWAVGERNGVPVNNDDVTYHNNAQYYAQQAQSIAPASVTEAVRWDIAQTALTDANKAQARSNIDAGKNGAWSNRNLLDNWYFVGGGSQLGDGVFPINQRGQASYSSAQVTIDRWTLFGGSVVLAADGITVTSSPDFGQVFEPSRLPVGTYTASVKTADGKIGSITFTTTGSQFFASGAMGDTGVTLNFIDLWTPDKSLFSLQCQGVKIAAAKLEEGTVSTLANDPPPDFGEELRKCQRYLEIATFGYQEIVGSGMALSDGAVIIDFVTAQPMRRTVPQISFSGTFYIVSGGQVSTLVSIDSPPYPVGTHQKIRCIPSATPTANTLYTLLSDQSSMITINHEL